MIGRDWLTNKVYIAIVLFIKRFLFLVSISLRYKYIVINV